MLPFTICGEGDPALLMLPFLGGSQQEWSETTHTISGRYRCVTADLPGFGAAASVAGYSVSAMGDAVIELLSSLHLGRYVLAGHSMAGKVSAVVARRLLSSGAPVAPPSALVLVAPSPPGPEPMSDSKRGEMLDSLGGELPLLAGRYSGTDRWAAERFVRENLAQPLPDARFRRTVDDVLSMNPAAWTAWLQSGSKEDWASYVGVLELPTLIVAGTQDGSLGPDAQRTHTLPHFSRGRLAEVNCSHLIPLERPGELASLISTFLEDHDAEVRL